MQVTSSFKGGKFANEAAPYLAEYVERKRLAKLGFTSSFDSLDSFKAAVFCLIDTELDELQAKELKRKS